MQRERRVKREPKVKLRWIVLLIILILGFATFIVLHQAEKPMATARSQTIAIAKKYADLKSATNFYSANLGKTYYSVAGKTTKNRPIYVIVAKKGGAVTVVNQRAGLSDTQIKNRLEQTKHPKKINSVGLTLIKQKPYWVVSYMNRHNNLCFATLNFKTGSVKKLIENI
ncbi:DUF5590 domain-containing protein [Lentilactobacillus raoultii]|uniref:DUF5590 domain-containing protein n=1 Tax=Lentilactobacillus raoultii TaxID=1987503 RepID=A0ABW3PGL9_9LACO|nr:DUF5590 domain-containing protein [Lentilactobacillus raoultii]